MRRSFWTIELLIWKYNVRKALSHFIHGEEFSVAEASSNRLENKKSVLRGNNS